MERLWGGREENREERGWRERGRGEKIQEKKQHYFALECLPVLGVQKNEL
jgi:hypothetical protein